MKTFELGELYFRVTYPDRRRWYPGIESFVFVGMNLSDEDMEDTWYFRPAADVPAYGSDLSAGPAGRPMVCATGADAGDMLTSDQLAVVLEKAAFRRKSKVD